MMERQGHRPGRPHQVNRGIFSVAVPKAKQLRFELDKESKVKLPPGLVLDPTTGALGGYLPNEIGKRYTEKKIAVTVLVLTNFTAPG